MEVGGPRFLKINIIPVTRRVQRVRTHPLRLPKDPLDQQCPTEGVSSADERRYAHAALVHAMVAEKGIPALHQYGARLPRARRAPVARLSRAFRAPVARLPRARRAPVARQARDNVLTVQYNYNYIYTRYVSAQMPRAECIIFC